jgi:cbb3-type cytochrome oxidase subunit 3
MRLARSVLENATGNNIFAIIGILIFFSFFIALIWWVIRMKSAKVKEYSRLPLDDEEEDTNSEVSDLTKSGNIK